MVCVQVGGISYHNYHGIAAQDEKEMIVRDFGDTNKVCLCTYIHELCTDLHLDNIPYASSLQVHVFRYSKILCLHYKYTCQGCLYICSEPILFLSKIVMFADYKMATKM